MAYQTGAAADIDALLTALKNFAVANGWALLVQDTVTLSFYNSYPSVGYARHDNAYSLVSSLSSSSAYKQGATSAAATRVVLARAGVTYQFFGFHKSFYKNGVLGTYAVLEAWVCDGWNGGVAAYQQANNRKYALIGPLATALYAYHMFSGGDYVHLVVEETPGRFRHLSFGFLAKYADFPGGQYLTAGCPIESATTSAYDFNTSIAMIPFGMNGQNTTKANLTNYAYAGTYVRADIDGLSVGWRVLSRGSSYVDATNGDAYGGGTYSNVATSRGGPSGTTTTRAIAHDLGYHCAPQSWNGLAPMLPCYAGVFRSPYNGNWTLLGEFPDVRFLNIANLNPGDELTLGTDVWKVFPVFAKEYSVLAEPISYDYALAYRKVV